MDVAGDTARSSGGVDEEAPATGFDEGIGLLQLGLIVEQLGNIQARAVLAAFPRDGTMGKDCFRGFPHMHLQSLFQLGFALLQTR